MYPNKATLHRASRTSAAAAAMLLTGTLAWADEPSPWYLGVVQGITHDSNVYRISGGPADTYSTTSLIAGFDQPISRQRVRASARVGYNKYASESTLDNTSYALSAGLDWATVYRLSGSVSASASQSLAQFNGNSLQPGTDKNVLKTDQISADVRWGGDGLLSMFGNYSHNQARYSSIRSLLSNSTSDSGSVGVNYRLGGKTTVGVALRTTRTDYPYGISPAPFLGNAIPPVRNPALDDRAAYGPDSSTSNNLDLLGNWRYSEQTGVNVRLSFTRLTYDNSGRDFSGLTGSVTGTYAPTAKLAFNASIGRDAGSTTTSTTYFDPATGQQNTFQNGSNQTNDSLVFGATYAATAKTSFNAGAVYRRGQSGDNSASDNYRTFTLGVNYVPARSWQLGCNLSHEGRSAGAFSYDANVIGCSAQFTLR